MVHPVAGLQTAPAPAGGHALHLVVLAAWAATVAAVVLVDHARGRRRRSDPGPDRPVADRPGAGAPGGPDRPLTLTAARSLMATWPPPRAPATAPLRAPAPRPAPSAHAAPARFRPLALAAGGSLAAAATHAVALPEHLAESYLYGAFFVGALVAQGTFALLLLRRPRRPLLRAGLAGNASMIVLWAWTRAVSVPLGPGAGSREQVGPLDLAAVAAELVVLAACALALRQPGGPPGSRPGGAR